MSPLSLFLVEVGICLATSAAAAAALTSGLRRVLADACGTPQRASFWTNCSNVMLFIAPLVAVAVFGKSGDGAGPTLAYFKAALGSALFGLFVALAAVGIQVAKLLPRRGPAAGGPAQGP